MQVTVEEPVTVGRDVNFEAQPARMLIHILVEYFLSCLGEFEQLVKSLIYFYNFKIVNTVINKCNSEDSSAHGGARGGGSKWGGRSGGNDHHQGYDHREQHHTGEAEVMKKTNEGNIEMLFVHVQKKRLDTFADFFFVQIVATIYLCFYGTWQKFIRMLDISWLPFFSTFT